MTTFIAQEFQQPVNEVLSLALMGKETANFEIALFTKAGTRREVLINATTRRGPNDEVTGVIGVGQDLRVSGVRAGARTPGAHLAHDGRRSWLRSTPSDPAAFGRAGRMRFRRDPSLDVVSRRRRAPCARALPGRPELHECEAPSQALFGWPWASAPLLKAPRTPRRGRPWEANHCSPKKGAKLGASRHVAVGGMIWRRQAPNNNGARSCRRATIPHFLKC